MWKRIFILGAPSVTSYVCVLSQSNGYCTYMAYRERCRLNFKLLRPLICVCVRAPFTVLYGSDSSQKTCYKDIKQTNFRCTQGAIRQTIAYQGLMRDKVSFELVYISVRKLTRCRALVWKTYGMSTFFTVTDGRMTSIWFYWWWTWDAFEAFANHAK